MNKLNQNLTTEWKYSEQDYPHCYN